MQLISFLCPTFLEYANSHVFLLTVPRVVSPLTNNCPPSGYHATSKCIAPYGEEFFLQILCFFIRSKVRFSSSSEVILYMWSVPSHPVVATNSPSGSKDPFKMLPSCPGLNINEQAYNLLNIINTIIVSVENCEMCVFGETQNVLAYPLDLGYGAFKLYS